MLDTSKWRSFQVRDLFDVTYGINMELNACTPADDEVDSVNFVGRAEDNNGVTARVKRVTGKEPQPAGIITCAGGGSVLSTFLQTEPFYSGRDLYLLRSKEKISISAKLFFITVLKANKYRYNYGRQANKTLPYIEVALPVTSDGKPDWAWMETFMSKYYQGPLQSQNRSPGRSLDVDTWHEFRVGSLFNLQRGKCHDSDSLDDGDDLFYVGAKKDDNGIMRKVTYQPDMVFPGNCMVFICNGAGSVGYALYQDCDFIPSGDLMIGYNENLNPYIGLFLVPILDRERDKYSFGRKWGKYVADTIIKLPATTDAKGRTVPDWAWMEQYMKSLPYSDLI